jgi:hypothetical protein
MEVLREEGGGLMSEVPLERSCLRILGVGCSFRVEELGARVELPAVYLLRVQVFPLVLGFTVWVLR